MATRMKGLIRGLRYISNIFDAKEQEMEIGYPTDVKHVAHIGWDGPSIGGPTWMNQFCSAPLEATGNGDGAEVPHFPSSEYILTGELPGLLSPKSLKKPSRRKKSSEKATERTAVESPKESSRYNQSHRRNSAGGSEPAESSRRGRREARHQTGDTSGAGAGGGENHSGEQELPGIPKAVSPPQSEGLIIDVERWQRLHAIIKIQSTSKCRSSGPPKQRRFSPGQNLGRCELLMRHACKYSPVGFL